MEQDNRKQDDAGDLRSWIEALRAREPTGQECDQARERLWQRLEAERRATPLKRASVTAASRPGRIDWRKVGWTAVAIAVAAVVIGLVGRPWPGAPPERPNEPIAWGEIVQGDCSRIGPAGEEHRLSSDDPLYAGDRVRVGLDSSLRLRTADGSRLLLWPGAEAVWLGRRSNAAPAIRLLRGEMRADIARVPDEVFSIDTPAAALRVLGTELDVRVLNGVEQEDELEEAGMSSDPNALARTFVVLTVLSGAVAVDAAGQEKIVHEGERTVVASGRAASAADKVANLDYLRHWLAKRLRRQPGGRPQEVLAAVDLRAGVLQVLSALDVQSGRRRQVAGFVGQDLDVADRAGNQLAIVTAGSPLWRYGLDSVTHSMDPLGGNMTYFVDLQTGEKLRIEPLREFRVGHVALSPDWRQLAFRGFGYRRSPKNPEGDGVYLLNLETLRVTPLPEGLAQTFDWSADSRWLASSMTADKSSEIVLYDTITGDLKRTGWKGMLPRFSPDGKRLVFVEGMHGFGRGMLRSATETWNLVMVGFPNGTPKPITHLKDRAASYPSFSPDGGRLVYWESPSGQWDFYGTKVLHDLDPRSGADRAVQTLYFSGGGAPGVQWLSDGKVAFWMLTDEPDMALMNDPAVEMAPLPSVYKCVDLTSSKPTLRELSLSEAGSFLEGHDRMIADELTEAFAAFRAGARAELLHVMDEASAQYARGGALLDAALRRVEKGQGKLGLQAEEIRAFRDVMVRLGAIDKAQRSFDLVREVLQKVMPLLLADYYPGYPRLRPEDREKATMDPVQWMHRVTQEKAPHRLDLEGCARQAPGNERRVKIARGWINCRDLPVIRRAFVVPGDDPDKVLTSYETVRPDKGDGVLVIRSPRLANGKRLQATYRVKERWRSTLGEERVLVEAEVVEVK